MGVVRVGLWGGNGGTSSRDSHEGGKAGLRRGVPLGGDTL